MMTSMLAIIAAQASGAGGGVTFPFGDTAKWESSEYASEPGVHLGSLTITKPTGSSNGDIFALILVTDDTAGSDSWTTPTGWTKLGHWGDGTSSSTLTIFWREVDGTEGASQAITWTGATTVDLAGYYVHFSGLDTTTPFIAGTATTAATATPTAASITTTVDGSLALSIVTKDGLEALTWTSPAGWTEFDKAHTDPGSAGADVAIAGKVMATAGATGAAASSYTGTTDGTLAIQLECVAQAGVVDYTGKTVIFALMGQSNMVGRDGPIDPVLDATNANVLMWDASGGSWVTAADPLDHIDEVAGDIGPGLTFGKDFLSGESATRVLLVGMAEGGTGFIVGDWTPNRPSSTYENVRDRWEAAYAQAITDYGAGNVVVGGALWIQGEDEIQDYPTLFNTASESRFEWLTMPTTMFEAARRGDFSGWDTNTPVVFGQVPPGSGLTGSTAYTEIQAAIADVGNRMEKAAYAVGTDLTTSDTVHYDAPAYRTMGSRLYTAHIAARTATASIVTAPPAFTQDASNVSTAFAFDVSTAGDGAPLIMQEGDFPAFENKRVWVSSGAMIFDSDAELRWSKNASRQDRPDLDGRDFLFKCTFTTNQSVEQGIWSCYDTVGNQRSYVLRVNTGPVLQFYGSSDGSSVTLMLSYSISTATEYDVEIRRVGTALTLHVDGILRDSYTLPGGYTFFDPTSLRMHIGDHINGRELNGNIVRCSLEYLS